MTMIPSKIRESRRVKALKLPRNIERLYKEGKCRECSVEVTRMNFAKILGKFTKVKIQYESSSKPRAKSATIKMTNNSRLRGNENGIVHNQPNANNHLNKHVLGPNKSEPTTPRQANNILKENNRLKKPVLKDKNSNYENTKKLISSNVKQYAIIFVDPKTNNNDVKNKICLSDLLPVIDSSILPSEEWCIDYFPKNDEPKDDKVYDRIAAELEDLMYSDKPLEKTDGKPEITEPKSEEFPSIMDILNDSSTEKVDHQTTAPEFKSNIESSDVEAMLLGKTNDSPTSLQVKPMEVDGTEISKTDLIADVELNAPKVTDDKPLQVPLVEVIDNPQSPSILDEALQKGIEEHLPSIAIKDSGTENETVAENGNVTEKEDVKENDNVTEIENVTENELVTENENVIDNVKINNIKEVDDKEAQSGTSDADLSATNNSNVENDEIKSDVPKDNPLISKIHIITEVVFKKCKDGKCYKTVTCPRNLKYTIDLEGKAVEFLGAPKFITSLEDLQVLLQIVNESELNSLYVMY